MMYCSKVRREFKAVISYEEDVNTLMDDWPEWRRKINVSLQKKLLLVPT